MGFHRVGAFGVSARPELTSAGWRPLAETVTVTRSEQSLNDAGRNVHSVGDGAEQRRGWHGRGGSADGVGDECGVGRPDRGGETEASTGPGTAAGPAFEPDAQLARRGYRRVGRRVDF